MLNEVLRLLHAQRWFDITSRFETSIHLTQAASLWMLLTRGGVADTYVKFSVQISLETEARRYAEASRFFGALVPDFVGFVKQGALQVMVCRAVEYRGLRKGEAGSARLMRYFAAMPSLRLPFELTPCLNRNLLDSLSDYFQLHPSGPWIARVLESPAAQRAQCLPNMPQHGDLVANNLGLRADGNVVIFDWEDFGACCLPGLDLFTLELSCADGAADLLNRRARPGTAPNQFLRNACAAIRLDWADYLALTPIYALVFRYLKRNYGPGVRARFDHILIDFSRRAVP